MSRRMRWARHIANMVEKIHIRKPEKDKQEAQKGWRILLKWFLEK
jgi:hypothetical protein